MTEASPAPSPSAGWKPWPPEDGEAHTVTGDVRILRGLRGPRQEDRRDVWVWLPPSLGSGDRRYPVFYLQDGQNLFDDATSFAGEWGVDEVMEDLAGDGVEAIVVGIANLDDRRLQEYSAWTDPRHGGGEADAYLDFLVDVVKARVDRDLPTLPDPTHTGIGGSSLGGLLALHALLSRSDVFGMGAIMSPALWYARRAALREAERRASGRGRIHLDVGTGEGWRTVRNARRLRRILLRHGYREGQSLRYVEDRGAPHHEYAWGRRFGPAVTFLLGDATRSPGR